MNFKKAISLFALTSFSAGVFSCSTADSLNKALLQPVDDVSALSSSNVKSGDIVPGEFIVKYKNNSTNAASVLLNSVGAKRVKDLKTLNAQVIKLDSPVTNSSDVLKKIASNPNIEWVEPNRFITLPKVTKDALDKSKSIVRKDEPVTLVPVDPFTPDDELFEKQYAHKVSQSEKGWALAKANSKKQSIIAIIDTGVDAEHPDLKAKMLPGYDAYGQGKENVDKQGHGTHCAGIAAAITNNKIGVAGFSLDSKIIPVKVLQDSGSGTYAAVADGIAWAAKSNADVLSMSLGGPSSSKAIEDSVNLALKNGKIVVAAMGNDGNERPSYPAAIPGVTAVGATDSNDKIARFSQFGKHISVSAPGVAIMSTFPTYSNGIGMTNYGAISGTSMACPAVSGLAGLIKSVNPSLNGAKIREVIEKTADDLGDKGFDKYYGHGRINVYKAMSYIVKQSR